MKRIWKYPLQPGRTRHSMPKGAHVMSAQWQGGPELGDMVLWALVDDTNQFEDRHFIVLGTGHDASEAQECSYISTAQVGGLVWHVFEVED